MQCRYPLYSFQHLRLLSTGKAAQQRPVELRLLIFPPAQRPVLMLFVGSALTTESLRTLFALNAICSSLRRRADTMLSCGWASPLALFALPARLFKTTTKIAVERRSGPQPDALLFSRFCPRLMLSTFVQRAVFCVFSSLFI